MAITKICSAYNNPVRSKIYTWKKADMVFVCEHITFIIWCPLYLRYTDPGVLDRIQWKVQQLMTNRIPLKWSTTWYDQTRENTAIQWLKKKAFTHFDLVRETQSTDPAWKQMKQDTRVDFNMYTYGCPGSCHWPQPKTILHLRKMIEQNGSRLPMHSMQRMTQTYQIGYHLHMMPFSTLASWMEARPTRLLDLMRCQLDS